MASVRIFYRDGPPEDFPQARLAVDDDFAGMLTVVTMRSGHRLFVRIPLDRIAKVESSR